MFCMYRTLIAIQETGAILKGFDPYEILEIEQGISVQDIKKAYRYRKLN